MLNLAHTEQELPDRKGAVQAITNARKALASARRFLFALANVDAGTTDQLGIEMTKLENAILRYDAEALNPATQL
ncbi:MAG: hypothetical protein JWO80_4828 [Bryobacterales bacterium]|nr:hypothetical protein [Bryobacterales bacterium]